MPQLHFKALNRKSSYQWYLGTSFWRERRELALEAANHKCEHCGNPATQIHNLTYLRVFNERPSDLIALCDPCHEAIHSLKPANDNQLPLTSPHLPATSKNSPSRPWVSSTSPP